MGGGEQINDAITVKLPIEEAFAHFVDDLGEWWPREFTWAGDDLDEIGIEPRPNGACFETTKDGSRQEWGRITRWEPPGHLAFSWQISPSRERIPRPGDATEVELSFSERDGAGTRVELEHRHFERHGEHGPGYRDALASEQGWPLILRRYAAG